MNRKLMSALIVASTLSLQSQAETSDSICSAYGSVGKVMASEMLDLTFRDIIGMQQGTRPDVVAKVTTAISTAWSADEIAAMSTLTEEEQGLIGEAAGGRGFGLLMGGTVTTPEGVKTAMVAECNSIGYRNIMDNQKKIRGLSSGG